MKINKKPLCFSVVFFVAFVFQTLSAFGAPNTITFQSKIAKPDGFPLEGSAVTFRLSLTDSVGSCVIYQEDFSNRNMSGSKGLINLSLGAGSQVYPGVAMTMAEAFNNYNSPTLNCQSGGTINPSPTDVRKLIVQFNDGSGWQTVPAMTINPVPSALQSITSQKLGDFDAADYVRTANIATCGGGQALHFNGTAFTCVAAGGAGAGTVTNVSSANTDIGVANPTNTPVLTLNSSVVGAADKIVKLDGSGNFGAINASALTNLNGSNIASGTVPAARMPALTGDVTTSVGTVATTIAANAVTSAKILDDEIVNADIKSNAAIARSKLAVGAANAVLVNDGSGVMTVLNCTSGQVVKFDGSNAPICGTDNAGTGDVINGGNTVTGTMTVGTNSNHNLEFETNGTSKMTILANGNVGIGTTNPSHKLQTLLEPTNTAFVDLAAGYFELNPAYTGASSANFRALRASIDTSNISAASTGLMSGVTSDVYKTNNYALPTLIGIQSNLTRAGGASTDMFGFQNNVFSSGSQASTNVRGTYNNVSAASASTQVAGSYNLVSQSAGTSTTGYGVYSSIDNSGAGNFTTAYGIYVGPVEGSTKYSVYTSDASAPSHFSGNVGVGLAGLPERLLHVNGPMRINPSGAPASPAAGDMYVDSGDSNKLKIYDGSGWVAAGGGGGGGVSQVTSANTDIGVASTTTTPVLTLNSSVAGAADKIVKLDGSGNFGAINASALTNLNASALASGTVPAARMPALTGDVTTSAGAVATSIAANAVTSAKILDDEIVDADIKAGAAIARTKLASGANNHVLINTSQGVMSSEAQLAVGRGGTGLASFTNNALIMANGTGTGLTNATCSTGEILMWNSTTWACTNMAASTQGYFKDGGNTFTGSATVGTNSNHDLNIETNNSTRIAVTNNGNVTINAAGSGTTLTVAGNIRQSSGQITSAPYNAGAATSFDLNNGNVQYTSVNCQAMTLSNMQDGGTYTIAVKGTTSGTCSFTHAGLNFWYSPAQGPTANGSQSTYTFIRMGTDVYVTWISLYQ